MFINLFHNEVDFLLSNVVPGTQETAPGGI
jgi:hypothetical protein